jgi:hypothetical protein
LIAGERRRRRRGAMLFGMWLRCSENSVDPSIAEWGGVLWLEGAARTTVVESSWKKKGTSIVKAGAL